MHFFSQQSSLPLDPIDWTFKEALLACEKINGKHTDNGPNIVKAIQLIGISHVSCCAYTLHLSVIKEPEEAEQDYEIISDEGIVEPAACINQPLIISRGRKRRHNTNK
ncbi:19384_t:CDS:2 [Funneliformis geosporum]|uniref:19384_t:CDS:1 n=1 Tax=Funneliformis geosporum TaxID=1117311 RepID=A0A9W4SRU5_9GLOM|nr:19384_t:CDS:2 [Funneliformis geosporum]